MWKEDVHGDDMILEPENLLQSICTTEYDISQKNGNIEY